jgi:DNA ligase 1
MLKPHLACDADLKLVKFPVYVQPKIDGVRALHINGSFCGRSLKPFANKNLMGYFNRPIFSGLDGELTIGSLLDGETCRRTTSGTNTIDGPPGSEFVYNVFDIGQYNRTYEARRAELRAYVDDLRSTDICNVRLVSIDWANNANEVLELHAKYLALGYEGSILRDPKGHYKSGRGTAREAAFLRIKDFHDAEALVLSIEESDENLNEATINELGHTTRSSHKENKRKNGMLGRMICRDITTGDTITVAPGKMTHEERKFYWENPDEVVGKLVKYKTMGYGKKDKPRFPTFQVFRSEIDMPS